jgi:hypothetical protein
MFILNTTYITTENNIPHWKKWLKEEAFQEGITFVTPEFRVYRIDHAAEEGQVSFSVQFLFDSMAMLDLFQEQLALIHQRSLSRKFGAQCLFFTTILAHEEL